MQAWLCETLDGVDALQWKEMPTPEPGPGEVRIAIRAASLNFPDSLTIVGKYQFRPDLPFVPGSEMSGVVDAIGEGVSTLAAGDRVAGISSSGAFGTHAILPAARVLRLPDDVGLDDAAAFAFTYGTSHHALVDRARLQPGETVLVLGAGGGVGSSAVQIAKAAGARVIAGASSDEKCAFARRHGADETINYASTPLRDALKSLCGSKGVDVVYDPVGADLAEPAFRSIAWRGRYLVIGFAGGSIPALPLNLPLLKGADIVGVFWGEFTRREPQAFQQGWSQLLQWYREGKVRPAIDCRWPMRQLRDAYARMASRQVLGKVLLVNA